MTLWKCPECNSVYAVRHRRHLSVTCETCGQDLAPNRGLPNYERVEVGES